MVVNLRGLSNYDVLTLWADAIDELKRRDVIRTNNIVGELAEVIAYEHFGGTRSHFSEKGWDVMTPEGERIQVKGVWRTSPTRTKVSAIRDASFDSLMVIVFDLRFGLEGAYQASRATIERMFAVNGHVNGRQPTITKKFVNDPDVMPVDVSVAHQRVLSTSLPVDQI